MSGRSATLWEYFEEFDSAYGSSHFIAPPTNLLASSLDGLPPLETTNMEQQSAQQTPARKRKLDEVLDFFKEEAQDTERRYQESIDRERQRIDILKDIRNLLQNLPLPIYCN